MASWTLRPPEVVEAVEAKNTTFPIFFLTWRSYVFGFLRLHLGAGVEGAPEEQATVVERRARHRLGDDQRPVTQACANVAPWTPGAFFSGASWPPAHDSKWSSAQRQFPGTGEVPGVE